MSKGTDYVQQARLLGEQVNRAVGQELGYSSLVFKLMGLSKFGYIPSTGSKERFNTARTHIFGGVMSLPLFCLLLKGSPETMEIVVFLITCFLCVYAFFEKRRLLQGARQVQLVRRPLGVQIIKISEVLPVNYLIGQLFIGLVFLVMLSWMVVIFLNKGVFLLAFVFCLLVVCVLGMVSKYLVALVLRAIK
ncbi:hypothetical protein A9Q99_15550 [Gammaproteobacteria bacterium 45_16_T64]|nr:hypothetical protein A9Q99_15550 [Gammaproteobacteria bacterium 45_16_T64]